MPIFSDNQGRAVSLLSPWPPVTPTTCRCRPLWQCNYHFFCSLRASVTNHPPGPQPGFRLMRGRTTHGVPHATVPQKGRIFSKDPGMYGIAAGAGVDCRLVSAAKGSAGCRLGSKEGLRCGVRKRGACAQHTRSRPEGRWLVAVEWEWGPSAQKLCTPGQGFKGILSFSAPPFFPLPGSGKGRARPGQPSRGAQPQAFQLAW